MIDNPRESLRVAKQFIGEDKAAVVQHLIEQKNRDLLEHQYFRMCRARLIDRERMLDVVRHLYCFSVYFERILARRITEYSSAKDPRILAIARAHMREEIGHAELFRACLEANGVGETEIRQLEPNTFTKAMFGYLTVTIQYESEYVSNVVIMQVMESIGYHFFSATLKLMQSHALVADAMVQHSEDDLEHANLGLELISSFDEATLRDCCRTIEGIYQLMPLVFDEWLGLPASIEQAALGVTA
jgi:pyrroloquinoline quinone (PQQ) biosynthesis protein C